MNTHDIEAVLHQYLTIDGYIAADDIPTIAAAIEAALQSEQVQEWKRDAERLDWLADPNNSIGNVQLPTECVTENLHSLRAAIDAARKGEGGAT